MQRPVSVLVAILITAGIAIQPAEAQQTPLIVVNATYETMPDGYRYYLAIYNNTDLVENQHVVQLDLTVYYPSGVMDTPFDLSSPPAPWYGSIVNGGNTDLVYWSIGGYRPPNWSAGVVPGQSLASFAFTSATQPQRMYYTAYAYNGSSVTGNWGDLYPEPVPEPASVLALGGGALVLIGFARRRRRR